MSTTPMNPPAAQRARDQAAAFSSVFAPTPLELSDHEVVMIPPHPNLRMLDDPCMQAYDELMFEVKTYDREPDVHFAEQKFDNGVIIPATTKRGALITPFQKEGELVKPPHSVRVVQAALGEDLYGKLRAGGKSAGDVWRIWNDQGLKIAERESADPFRNTGVGAVGAVPGGNSV